MPLISPLMPVPQVIVLLSCLYYTSECITHLMLGCAVYLNSAWQCWSHYTSLSLLCIVSVHHWTQITQYDVDSCSVKLRWYRIRILCEKIIPFYFSDKKAKVPLLLVDCHTAYCTGESVLISRFNDLELAASLHSSLAAEALSDVGGKPHVSTHLLPFASISHVPNYMD